MTDSMTNARRPVNPDDAVAEIIAEMKAEYGEPTAEEYAWADQVIAVANASSGLFSRSALQRMLDADGRGHGT